MKDLSNIRQLLSYFYDELLEANVSELNKFEYIEKFIDQFKQDQRDNKLKHIKIEMDDICALIANYFKLPADMMKQDTNKREVVELRFWNMYYMKYATNKTLQEIGDYCAGRDHSSICHAIKTINNQCDVNGRSYLLSETTFRQIELELTHLIKQYGKEE